MQMEINKGVVGKKTPTFKYVAYGLAQKDNMWHVVKIRFNAETEETSSFEYVEKAEELSIAREAIKIVLGRENFGV